MSVHITQLRTIVADRAPAAEEMAPYLAKLRKRAYTVTDADIEKLTAAGVTEDEIFKQTVAIGQGLRRSDAEIGAIG